MTSIPKILAFALVFAVPLSASAQVTAHQLTMKLKTLGQTTNNADDLKPDKASANWKDVFDACIGRSPEKDEGIFLFMDCSDLNDNTIAVMDTDPVEVLDFIGSANLDLGNLVLNEKNGVAQSASVPVSIGIECEGAEFEAFGILDVKFKDLDGEQCPNSGSVKLTGTGSADEPGDFILDNGSSINAKKRTAAFSNSFPPAP